MTRESLAFDVLIVGAGPSGLAAAIHLKQLALKENLDLKVAVIEKAAEIGGHIISGAVLEPRAFNELIPEWKTLGAPIVTEVSQDKFVFLTKKHHFTLPTPPQMRNKGNYIISLSQVCKWLSVHAENLGVEIFPGFAAKEPLYDTNDRVIGVTTGDLGINKKGEQKGNFQPGIDLLATYTLLAEGCRGSLTKILMEKFALQANSDPQTYGIGLKEVWEIDASQHVLGRVVHTVGWPLDYKTYGGSFLYHFENNQVSIGFVVGLDYENPKLDPYEEFQQFKHHPFIAKILQGGRRISYGARALNEGGLQSIPKLIFPGGALIGCAAGFLNVPKIKGNHTAMKSGMLAAEAVFNAFKKEKPPVLTSYETAIQKSWIYQELKLARNIRPAFRYGLLPGLAYAATDTYLFRGRAPWTLRNKEPDNLCLVKTNECPNKVYPKHDGILSFDKLNSVALTNTSHEEDQPVHLVLADKFVPININLTLYGAPEQRYCPAQVYEIVKNEKNESYLQINAPNCIHCKTCDIKDVTQNITWVPPEGGGGPNYTNM